MGNVCNNMAKEVGISTDTAIDAGAGPGRSSFVMAELFKHVETFDYSHGFIDMLHKKKPLMLSKEIADRIIGY
jgi:ubiquinone/menaquinone biosynthesis C-methylase UbiE